MIHFSRWWYGKDNTDDWTANPNAKDILKGCSLSFHDYTKKGLWVGTGDTNCTDPKTLRKQISTTLINLGIETFKVTTFDHAKFYLKLNDLSLRWTLLYVYPMRDCLTLSMPENLRKKGIWELGIITPNDSPFPNLMVHVHQNGLQFTDTPDAWHQIEVTGKGRQTITVVHDVVELLKYDGEKCENDKDYKLSECELEYIDQASDF